MQTENKAKRIPLPKKTKKKVWIITIIFTILELSYTAYRLKLNNGPIAMDTKGIVIIAIREIITVVLVYNFLIFIARWRWLQR